MKRTRTTPSRSVLLLDPNPDFLKETSRLLQKEGCEVVALRDPISAIHYLAGSSKRFDLVISDSFVLRITGAEFLGLYQRMFPQTPMLLLVSRNGDGDPREVLKVGTADCLYKPLSKSQFLAFIHRALPSREKRKGRQVRIRLGASPKSAKQKPIRV